MRKTLALFVIAFGLTACNSSEQNTENNEVDTQKLIVEEQSTVGDAANNELVENSDGAAEITFATSVYEFGEVKEGEKVEHIFKFTNTGKSPLIISNVSASCGCTTPEYSTHPIAPNEEGSVKVVFDTQNQVGMQQKIITILSNAEPTRTVIQLKGQVNKIIK